MSRSSPATLEMVEQFATIRHAFAVIHAEGPTPVALGMVFAASLVAKEIRDDPTTADDGDLRREAAYQEFRRQALKELLPILEGHFLQALSIRDDARDASADGLAAAVDMARCLMALGTLVGQSRGSARIGVELAKRVDAHCREARRLLEAPEPADLPLLAANQRVIDEMLETLDLLGDPQNGLLIRQQSRILARAALARVTATLERFLQQGGLDARFDMATVLAATDDLLVVARRVIEGVGEEYDPVAERYASSLGMEALRRFAAAILAIEQQTLRTSVSAIEKAVVSGEVFAASLLMLVKLHGLGRAILESATGSAATAEARAVERAEQLLRPRAMVQGVEYAAQQMDRLLIDRVRDGSDAARRLDEYAMVFEDFKRQTGLGPVNRPTAVPCGADGR